MNKKNVASFILYFFVESLRANPSSVPELSVTEPTHFEEINLKPGARLTLQCRGQNAMEWNFPSGTDTEQRLTFVPQRFNPRFGAHISEMTLSDASYEDTGNYGCKEMEGDGQLPATSRIYVYVNDPERLFVPNQSSNQYQGRPDLISFRQGKPVRLPCRVTNPSAQVTLIKGASEEEVALNEDVKYDPKLGFTLLYPNLFYSGEFICRARLGRRVEDQKFILNYLQSTVMPQPRILTSKKSYAVGDRITLTCRVYVSTDTFMTMTWSKDNAVLQDSDRVEIRDTERDKEAIGYNYSVVRSTIIIRDANQLDSGLYSCSVLDHNNHSNNADINIRVAGTEPASGHDTTSGDLVAYQI